MNRILSLLAPLLVCSAATAIAQQIPATLFGMHDDWLYVTPGISFGTARLWDVNNSAGNNVTRWDTLANCVPNQTTCTATNNNWNWSDFDNVLADIYTQCPTCDVTYTFGGIAQYANQCPPQTGHSSGCPSNDPNGVGCGNTRNGGCYLPPDILSDGSGTNNSMITFWSFLATHLAQLKLTPGYAPVTSFSLGNEYYRNPCIDPGYNQSDCTNGNPTGDYTFVATYAQLQRMFADMKATVSGISIGYSVKFLNGSTGQQTELIQNMMYCDGNTTSSPCGCPNNNNGSGYACKCSGSSGGCGNSGNNCSGGVGNKCGLSGFVDAMDFHDYLSDGSGQGEEITSGISNVRNALTGTDQNLPIWITETSFSNDHNLQDWDMQAGFAARLMISCWSGGAARCYWYRFNTWGCHDLHRTSDWATGTMYDNTEDQNGDPMTNMDQCQTGEAPGLWWDGVAYNRVYGWLVGSTMISTVTGCLTNSSNVTTCNLTDPSGNPEQIVWWNDSSQQTDWCYGSTPITHGTCYTTQYAYPSNFHYYQTLDPTQGTLPILGTRVNISGQPILLLQTATQ